MGGGQAPEGPLTAVSGLPAGLAVHEAAVGPQGVLAAPGAAHAAAVLLALVPVCGEKERQRAVWLGLRTQTQTREKANKQGCAQSPARALAHAGWREGGRRLGKPRGPPRPRR